MSDLSFYSQAAEVEGLRDLLELALDLRWSWNHSADELWGQLDSELWTLTQNPLVVLQTVSRTKLKKLGADPGFRKKAEALVQAQREYLEASAWFQETHTNSPLTSVAYFSMEFMLSEALPIYSGGLGNVAGDQLKAASDLGVPLVGIGLLYQQGYFRQALGADGAQRALYPYNDPGQLPISPVRQPDGEWLRLEVPLPGYKLWVRAWQVQVGRVRLYLLDSNDPANMPVDRGITSELYGGGEELRLAQEMLLGITGWRLLRALGIQPEVCHLNEGHAAFVVLERARSFMEDTGQPFDVALTATRHGNLFTTHTPVAAGFDRFHPALASKYLSSYAEEALGITIEDLLALGRANPADSYEPFNMAYLAIRGSGAVNGVSHLHGHVSRRIFQCLFPRWPEAEVPVSSVTNGVHVPSWDSAAADALWAKACGQDRWRGTMENVAVEIRCVSDHEIWQLRTEGRRDLINYARERLAKQLAASGASIREIDESYRIFDSNTLTMGFARRFATYKRPNLLLHDPERLVRLLTDPLHPVQLIIAGKAHPRDTAGQVLVQAWVQFSKRPEVRSHVIFLSDYDMLLAQQLVQGVDLWINTPRRPWEASGTSGMKVLVNGGLNLSELDGWWAEAYSPEVGWALGDGEEHGEDPAWDAAEAEALYAVLEQEIIPGFYTRDESGVPSGWVARIRESLSRLTPRFSSNRTVREYTEQYYLPAAAAYRRRAAAKGALGEQLLTWKRGIELKWPGARFGHMWMETSADSQVFQLQVYLGELDPEAVRVELYADAKGNETAVTHAMTRGPGLVGAVNGYLYRAEIPGCRAAADYTPRLVPFHPEAVVPLEAAQILWQR